MQASGIWCSLLHCNVFTTKDSCLNRILHLQIKYDQALGSWIKHHTFYRIDSIRQLIQHTRPLMTWTVQAQTPAALLALRQLSQILKGWSLVQYVLHRQLRGKYLMVKQSWVVQSTDGANCLPIPWTDIICSPFTISVINILCVKQVYSMESPLMIGQQPIQCNRTAMKSSLIPVLGRELL